MRVTLLFLMLAAPAAAQTYSGELGAGDPTRDGGQPYDAYTFEATQGQEVFVRMAGPEDLDTFLVLRSPSGAEWTGDDHEGRTNESRVEMTAPEGGTWTAWASGYGEDARGPYQLTVLLGEVAEVAVVEGALAFGDERCVKGEYFDTVAFEPPAEGPFAVDLLTPAFDGFLRVVAPSGREWTNDDAGSATRSRVEFLPYEAGTWTAQVTSLLSEQVGDYTLLVVAYPAGE